MDPAIESAIANPTEVLDPDQTVEVRGGRVTVRELSWKGARRLLRELSGKAGAFLQASPAGEVRLDASALTGALVSEAELLVEEATDLATPAQREALSATDFLRVLNAAVKLNLRPELIEAGNALATTIQALRGAASASPTTS